MYSYNPNDKYNGGKGNRGLIIALIVLVIVLIVFVAGAVVMHVVWNNSESDGVQPSDLCGTPESSSFLTPNSADDSAPTSIPSTPSTSSTSSENYTKSTVSPYFINYLGYLFSGSYTGEVDSSNTPNGKGVYTGSKSGDSSLSISYNGDFVDGELNGDGTVVVTNTDSGVRNTITAKWSRGNIMAGRLLVTNESLNDSSTVIKMDVVTTTTDEDGTGTVSLYVDNRLDMKCEGSYRIEGMDLVPHGNQVCTIYNEDGRYAIFKGTLYDSFKPDTGEITVYDSNGNIVKSQTYRNGEQQ